MPRWVDEARYRAAVDQASRELAERITVLSEALRKAERDRAHWYFANALITKRDQLP